MTVVYGLIFPRKNTTNQNCVIILNIPKSDDSSEDIRQTLREDRAQKIVIFQTNEEEENENEESDSETEYEEVNSTLKIFKYEKVIIKSEPLGLICQNIKYFKDGNISKWDSEEPKYGIHIITTGNKELKKVSIAYITNIIENNKK